MLNNLNLTTKNNELVSVYTRGNYERVVLDIEDQEDPKHPKYIVLTLTPQEAATIGTRLLAMATFCDDEV